MNLGRLRMEENDEAGNDALFFRAVKHIWGGLRRLLTSCQLDIDFNTLASMVDNKTPFCCALQKQPLSVMDGLLSFFHLTGNVFQPGALWLFSSMGE